MFATEYRADPGDVLVVSGGQQGLVFTMRTLAEPGATVITESPSYPGAILAAQSAGLTIASVPWPTKTGSSSNGWPMSWNVPARVIYLQPSYANPTGTVLSRERRTQAAVHPRRPTRRVHHRRRRS